MKNFFLGFITMTFVLAAGGAAWLQLGLADVRADERASAWVRAYTRLATRAAVHRNAKGLIPPTIVTDSMLIAGGHAYVNGCVGCHGALDHPRKPDSIPVFRPIPELPEVGTSYTPAEIHWVIDHGIRHSEMSAYGSSYKPEELWALTMFVANIRSLPPAVQDSLRAPGK